MDTYHFFLYLVIILVSSRLLGEWVAKLGVPAVIGELLAGVILGPSLLNVVELNDFIKLLAEIGLIMLLFEVGLETDIKQLAQSGVKASLCAFTGVIVPFILGFFISYNLFHLSLITSLFIGGTLTATSIGITMRVLADLKKHKTPEAQIVLGAAVLDDIIGIIVLSLLYEFSTEGGIVWIKVGKVLVLTSLFMILSPIAARIISNAIRVFEPVSSIPGLLPSSMVSLILLFAWIAHQFGSPSLLGGFAAGIALSHLFILPWENPAFHSEKSFLNRVDTQMKPIIHLFTPLFFVVIGLSVNLKEVAWGAPFVWGFSGLLLVAAFIGKILSGLVLVSEKRSIRWVVGLAMIPRGEVGLIFVNIGKSVGVFDHNLYASLIIVIILTTFIPPFAIRRFYLQHKLSM